MSSTSVTTCTRDAEVSAGAAVAAASEGGTVGVCTDGSAGSLGSDASVAGGAEPVAGLAGAGVVTAAGADRSPKSRFHCTRFIQSSNATAIHR